MTTDQSPDPILAHAVEAIMRGMSDSLDQIWLRPDASQTVEGFLAGRVIFVVSRDEIAVRELPSDTPEPPPLTGQYL